MKYLIISLFLFIGCGGGDWSEDLGHKYKYISEGPKLEWIMLEGAFSLEEADLNYIPCDIQNYKYNKQYIIAKIKFYYQNNRCVVGFEESKVLDEEGIYYYIIDKEKKMRYGAYNRIDFDVKVKELDINLKI